MEKVCTPFRNAKILMVDLFVSGSVISFSGTCLTFLPLKGKTSNCAAATDACVHCKCTDNLAVVAVAWIVPSHSYQMSPSSAFCVLTHCRMTLQLNSWTLVSDLKTIVISHWSKKSEPVPAISQVCRTPSSPCSAIRLNHRAPPCMLYFWLRFPAHMASSKCFSNRKDGDSNVLTQLYKLTVRMLSWEKGLDSGCGRSWT